MIYGINFLQVKNSLFIVVVSIVKIVFVFILIEFFVIILLIKLEKLNFIDFKCVYVLEIIIFQNRFVFGL